MKPKKEALSHFFDAKQQAFYLELAKEYLSYLGNNNPNMMQLRELQWLLSQVWVPRFMGIDSRLTQKEGTTLYFSARGKTTKQIARFSKISPRQVERHRAMIFEKLNCNNIAEAVMKGIRFLEIKSCLEEDEV